MTKLNVLHIPSWYPNREDEQLGIFIQKQIKITTSFSNNYVLYLQSTKNTRSTDTKVTKQSGVTLIHVTYPQGINVFSRLRNFLNAVTTGLSKLLDFNVKIDIVHCHVAGKNLWIAQKYFKQTPLVLSEHWSGFLNGNFEKQAIWKQKLTLKRINKSNKIIVVSPFLQQALQQHNITVPISIIDNVVEVTKIKEKKNLNALKFLVVADLVDEVKNISGIIDAFGELKKEIPNKISLTIIGDGKDKEKLEQQVTKLQLENNIIFKGRLANNEVLETYVNYDCLVVNSYFETYSLVTAEALSVGIPVIASKCKGAEQFVIHKQNGLLVETNNNQSLKKAMQYVVDNPQVFLPQEIRKSIENRLNNNQIADKLKKVYADVIQNK